MKKLILVGIDPGLTIGLAALDVEGNLVLVTSYRGLSLNALIEKLTKEGKPFVVASDVINVPRFTLKVARALRVPLIKPIREFSYRKKRALVKEFWPELKLRNRHEVTALFASVHAFKKIRPLIEKVKRKKLGSELEAKVLLALLKGEASNIKGAIEKFK